MIYFIEMPSGKIVPVRANDEEEARKEFNRMHPCKTISYVWDK